MTLVENIPVLLNEIRTLASNEYQNRIPVAQQDRFDEVGTPMRNWLPGQNEFLDILLNKIGLTYVRSAIATNKLQRFKKGTLAFGDTIEEIWVDMAKAKTFDVERAESEVFKREKPTIDVMYHKINSELMWKTTIQRSQLNRAFTSERNLTELVSKILQSIYNAMYYEEYVQMKELFTHAYENGNVNVVYGVTEPTDAESAKDFVKAIKRVAKAMPYMNDAFNKAKKMTRTEQRNMILFINKDISIDVSTELLASAFNKGEFDYNVQVVELDGLGSNTNLHCALVDADWLQVYDTFLESGSIYNPEGLYWNYTLHHHALYSYSFFVNAVFFTKEEQPVESE